MDFTQITPRKKHYNRLEELLEELPPLRQLNNKRVSFKGDRVTVRVRRKQLDRKPLLYLWDLDRQCYLSSLYPQEGGGFLFEVAGEYYRLFFEEGAPKVCPAERKTA